MNIITLEAILQGESLKDVAIELPVLSIGCSWCHVSVFHSSVLSKSQSLAIEVFAFDIVEVIIFTFAWDSLSIFNHKLGVNGDEVHHSVHFVLLFFFVSLLIWSSLHAGLFAHVSWVIPSVCSAVNIVTSTNLFLLVGWVNFTLYFAGIIILHLLNIGNKSQVTHLWFAFIIAGLLHLIAFVLTIVPILVLSFFITKGHTAYPHLTVSLASSEFSMAFFFVAGLFTGITRVVSTKAFTVDIFFRALKEVAR